MRLTPKIAGTAVAVLALGGAGIGTAVAASANAGAAAAVRAAQPEPAGPDSDAIQQGDQTSPDYAAAAVGQAIPTDNPGEAASSENSAASDGPGGHADPSGDVQHEFGGVE
ncbi:MAG TPA: hypothetical protein VIX86_13080 [Streptosporangiaceae bacterium]